MRPLFVCSGATIRWTHRQFNHDDGPIHHGLVYCFILSTVEITRSEATDCPCASCVVCGFESVSGYYHSSFYRVRCFSPAFILSTNLIFRIGRTREHIDFMHKPILTNYYPSGYWRNLWSSLDFADQPLKSCVNIIHVDIVEIWNLCDKTKVSSPQSTCYFNCLTESVSVKQPIQSKYVPRRQRTCRAGWRRIVEVSV